MGHDHNNNSKKLGWTILLNVIITVVEYVGGIFSGSLALLSDAGHNLSDVISLILGYFGEKISDKQANNKHSFGFKRFEIFTALINALSLVAIAFYIIFEAFQRLNEPKEISLGLMLGVGFIGLLGNFVSILILYREKSSSINMKATYMHLFYDTISSVFVIISVVIIYFTDYAFIDIIVSIIIAILILYSGFDIIKKTIHIFMQGVPEGIEFDEVHKLINNIDGVNSIHELHIWSVNSNETFLSCHICVGKIKKLETDNLLKYLNKILKTKFNITNSAIQIETKNICDNKKRGDN